MRFTITHLSQFEALYVPVPRSGDYGAFQGDYVDSDKIRPRKGNSPAAEDPAAGDDPS
jgi:hypothetical protein